MLNSFHSRSMFPLNELLFKLSFAIDFLDFNTGLYSWGQCPNWSLTVGYNLWCGHCLFEFLFPRLPFRPSSGGHSEFQSCWTFSMSLKWVHPQIFVNNLSEENLNKHLDLMKQQLWKQCIGCPHKKSAVTFKVLLQYRTHNYLKGTVIKMGQRVNTGSFFFFFWKMLSSKGLACDSIKQLMFDILRLGYKIQ